jgi:hypothetical protein
MHTRPTSRVTASEYFHYDTVHISRITLLPNIVDTPVLTGVQVSAVFFFKL